MILSKIARKVRGIFYSFTKNISLRTLGKNNRIMGTKFIQCSNLSLGDNCWIQAVDKYKKQVFKPTIRFGERVMMSNNVHISAVEKIVIGNHVLLGSNIYIGDHSHGSTKIGNFDPLVAPALRNLDDISGIEIGDNVWICDGVIILAGSVIGKGSVVAAQALVKGRFPENCLIAGNPAKIIKRLS